MELDINTWWTSFTLFRPGPDGAIDASNLLPSMIRSPNRYFSASTRDFVEIDARRTVGANVDNFGRPSVQ